VPRTTLRGVRVRYETIEFGDLDIHVRALRDLQECETKSDSMDDSASWSVFGVVWDSARALAGMMVDYDVGERRVLEIGCGIGLSSLVLKSRGLDITATDRHHRAAEFLSHNTDINGFGPIPFARLDWDTVEDEPTSRLGRFDLIIASDVLYERGHPESVTGFIARHAHPTCEVILVDPGRQNCGRYDRQMQDHGFSRSAFERTKPSPESAPKMRRLRHLRVSVPAKT
jgi:predicted nicotinamide N-methyase